MREILEIDPEGLLNIPDLLSQLDLMPQLESVPSTLETAKIQGKMDELTPLESIHYPNNGQLYTGN